MEKRRRLILGRGRRSLLYLFLDDVEGTLGVVVCSSLLCLPLSGLVWGEWHAFSNPVAFFDIPRFGVLTNKHAERDCSGPLSGGEEFSIVSLLLFSWGRGNLGPGERGEKLLDIPQGPATTWSPRLVKVSHFLASLIADEERLKTWRLPFGLQAVEARVVVAF